MGPWKVIEDEGFWVVPEEEGLFSPKEVGFMAIIPVPLDYEDHARLFAAAPDLLSACERLLANFHNALRGVPVQDASETTAEAEAAIAKAEGRDQ